MSIFPPRWVVYLYRTDNGVARKRGKIEFIPIKLLAATGSDAPGSCAAHSRGHRLTPQLLELTVFGAILLAPSVTAPTSREWGD